MIASLLAMVSLLAIHPAVAGGPAEQRMVRLTASPVQELTGPSALVDRVTAGAVMRIFVSDGVPDALGNVQQCRRTLDGFADCTNRFPVLFDAGGRAAFQYQLDDPGGCGATASCVVVVRDSGEATAAYASLVFGEPAPPRPIIGINPAGPYARGQRVTITISSLPDAAEVTAAYCAATCPGEQTARATPDGTATITLEIGGRCDNCGIAVITGPRYSFTLVEFQRIPTADYDPRRLLGGLVAAALLVALAWWIIATTDWRPPSEAGTPEFDVDI